MPDLPDRPDLAQLRRQAKDLLKAHRADESAARRRIDARRTESRNRRNTQIKLTDTQRVVACEHGFDSWAGMKRHIEALRQDTPIDAESVALDTEADGMDKDTDRTSFAETLERIEELQGAMESMFEPAPGWEWHTRPENRKGRYGGVSAGRGIVLHRTTHTDYRGAGAEPGQPYLRVYLARGHREDEPQPEYRPVAYDRDGARHILNGGGGGTSGDDGVTTAMQMFTLKPEELHPDGVAFLGIEMKRPTEDDTE